MRLNARIKYLFNILLRREAAQRQKSSLLGKALQPAKLLLAFAFIYNQMAISKCTILITLDIFNHIARALEQAMKCANVKH